jgi:diguanylate cyclase (GGDEF)-like protein
MRRSGALDAAPTASRIGMAGSTGAGGSPFHAEHQQAAQSRHSPTPLTTERRVVAAVLPAHSDTALARLLNGAGFDVAPVDDVPALLAASGPAGPDVAVLDDDRLDSVLRMLDRMRAEAALAHLPTVVVGRSTARRTAALRQGADDFVKRPFDDEDLVERLRGMVRRSRTLRSMSPLTGLPGNVEIDRLLRSLVDDPTADYAVLYADLDNFKAYNDAYGFTFGDEVLCATADMLRDALAVCPTERDFLGHLGGDDFVLVAGSADMEALCARIMARFDAAAATLQRRAPSLTLRGRRRVPALSISVGVATTGHRPMSSVWEVSAVATEMKHRAKRIAGSSYAIDRRRGWARMGQPAAHRRMGSAEVTGVPRARRAAAVEAARDGAA